MTGTVERWGKRALKEYLKKKALPKKNKNYFVRVYHVWVRTLDQTHH